MSRRLRGVVLISAAVVLFAGAAPQRPVDSDLKRVRQEIADLRTKLERVRSVAKSTEQELQAVDLELDIHARELQLARELLERLDQQQTAAGQRIALLSTSIGRQKEVLGQRLAALYKLGSLGYLRIMLSVDSKENPLEAISMMTYVVERDARLVRTFRDESTQLQQERLALGERKRKVSETQANIAQQQLAIEQKRREKATLLASLNSQSASSEQRLAVLQEKELRLQRLMDLLYSRQQAQNPTGSRVVEYKGALPWPVRGEVLERFGKQRSGKFATFVQSNGMKIAASPGAEVRAVFGGTVLFAQWFKGYGNLLIIDHGDRIFSLYGNTRGSTLSVGDRVIAGQVITTVAESEDGSAGYLYFEIREDNRPTDPQTWLR